jgi:hypothetical protein
MQQPGVFKVNFLYRAAVDLADNEKISLWEFKRSGTVQFQPGVVQLNGKWRVSPIGYFMSNGLLGELLIKPLILKARSESIPVQNLERVIIVQKKKKFTFHLFQGRDQGMVEVHVFTADKTTLPQVLESLKAVVPANLLVEQDLG